MVSLHKTFGLTTLCLLVLMMVGWASTAAFSQQGEKVIKKKIIIKTIDDNGVEQTQIIEEEGDASDFSGFDLFEGQGKLPPIFHKEGNSHHLFEEMNRQKKVLVLEEGEQIPEDLKAEILAMGLDVAEIEQKLAAAQKSVRILKEGSQAAKVEVDKDDILTLSNNNGPKRIMKFMTGDEQTLDIDVDIEELDGEGSGIINLNNNGDIQTFNFEGTDIPEDVITQLEELGINLDELGDGDQGKMMILKLDKEDMNFDQLKQGKGMMWMDDEGNSFNLDDCKFKGADKSRCNKIQKNNCCDGCSPGNCCEKCKTACSPSASKSTCTKVKNQKPRLGVFLEGDDSNGVAVKDIAAKSSAELGGLQAGDLILAINKVKVITNQQLAEVIGEHKVGDKIVIKYQRAGKTKKTKVTLQAAPERRYGKSHHRRASHDHSFMPRGPRHFQPNCEQACKTPILGVMIDEDVERGVHVNSIFDKSGAAAAGIQKEDVILSIAGAEVNTTEELIAKVKEYQPGEEVTITYLRNGKEAKTTATLASLATSRYAPQCDCDSPTFRKEVEVSKEIILIKADALSEVEHEGITIFEQEKETTRESDNLLVNDFSLFPNPNQGNFTVSFKMESNEPLTVTVVDVVGKEVYREEVREFSGNYNKKIDVSKYAKGTYFLNILQGEDVYTQQFVYN